MKPVATASKAALLGIVVLGTALAMLGAPLQAAITPEHRKEVAEIRKDVARTTALLAKDELTEAATILNDAESKLRKIMQEAGVAENDRLLAPVFRLIATKRAVLEKKQPDGEGISFSKDIAPILVGKCGNCHNSNRSSGGLALDTFAGMKEGGSSGPLLVVGNAQGSLLLRRLTATGNARMPRNAPALPAAEIAKITTWINQGAKFDGENESAKLSARPAGGNQPAGDTTPTPIVRATGDETVSFTKDIAPWMANLCVGCHGGNNPRGGLSLVTFEDMMKGGNSGRIILPGNWEGSLLWKLVGEQDPIKMPQGQALITRKNWNDLRTWLQEGAKFDGNDPKTPLRSLVPSQADMRAAELAKYTPEEFNKYRLDRSAEQWKRANPKENARWVESQEFFVYGNVSEARLREIDTWAQEHAKQLRSVFNIKETPIWKGKLTIFVFKDRFGYEEFPRVIDRQEVPRETRGHSKVVPSFEDAYICLEDIGDDVSAESPGLHVSLIDHLTGAYLKRSSATMPDWVVRGTGLAFAAMHDRKNEYIRGLHTGAMDSLKGLAKPEDIFANGTFSSAEVGPVGYTLVEYMINAGGAANFGRFVASLQAGNPVTAALRSVYNADMNAIAGAYYNSLATAKPARGR